MLMLTFRWAAILRTHWRVHRPPKSQGRVTGHVNVALAATALGNASKNVNEVLVRAAATKGVRGSAGVTSDG